MAKKLYEYVVFKQEKTNKNGEVTDAAEVLVPSTMLLAKDENEVNMKAARAIPEEQVENLDRIVIAVRPF